MATHTLLQAPAQSKGQPISYLRFQSLGLPGTFLNVERLSQFGAQELPGQIDTVMDVFFSASLTFFAGWGLYLFGRGLMLRPATAA